MKKKIKIKISARFGQFSISSWMEKGHEPSWAELKIFQLELWLEPAWLGLITSNLPIEAKGIPNIYAKSRTTKSIPGLYRNLGDAQFQKMPNLAKKMPND